MRPPPAVFSGAERRVVIVASSRALHRGRFSSKKAACPDLPFRCPARFCSEANPR
jgi:hypothetical protein